MEDHYLDDIEEESKLKKTIKRIATISIGIFMIMLLLSQFGLGPHIVDVLGGRLASDNLDQDLSITLDDGTKIQFDQTLYKELLAHYDSKGTDETKVCLFGEKIGIYYFLDEIYYPEIFASDVFSVTAQICPENTLVPLHTHPEGRCLYSRQDSRSQKSFKKINPDAISGVMCTKTRFGFYK